MQLSYQHIFQPGTDSSAPTLLVLHGTGGDEHDLLTMGRDLSPGSSLLSPRGDVMENGMPRFFRRFAEGVFDLADVEKRANALADFISAATEKYGIDRRRLIAVGYSNGANIAVSLLLLRPESLAGAILLRPMVVLEPEKLPDLSGKSILISSGFKDPIVPGDHPPRLADQLRTAGAKVTLNSLSTSHGLIPADFKAGKEFIFSLALSQKSFV